MALTRELASAVGPDGHHREEIVVVELLVQVLQQSEAFRFAPVRVEHDEIEDPFFEPGVENGWVRAGAHASVACLLQSAHEETEGVGVGVDDKNARVGISGVDQETYPRSMLMLPVSTAGRPIFTGGTTFVLGWLQPEALSRPSS